MVLGFRALGSAYYSCGVYGALQCAIRALAEAQNRMCVGRALTGWAQKVSPAFLRDFPIPFFANIMAFLNYTMRNKSNDRREIA